MVVSGSDFEDAWNFKLEPQDEEPLLNRSGRSHVLGPTLKRQVIERRFEKCTFNGEIRRARIWLGGVTEN